MTACILCGADGVTPFLDLGATALANAFLSHDELERDEAVYPLRAGFCETCHHVQLTTPAPPAEMFSHYLYISSASSTLAAHLEGLAATVTRRCGLASDDLVVDIGCNDGTLLASFGKVGARNRLGVDPAANLAALAAEKGVETEVCFFTGDSARRIRAKHGAARVITMTNAFPHIPNLPDLLSGIDALLAEDGTLVIEAHYLGDLIDMLAFDTVYHEHISYWALTPARRLFADHGFEVVDVERLPIRHGQLRLWVRRRGVETPSIAVDALVAAEEVAGLGRIATYQAFADKVLGARDALHAWLAERRAAGDAVAGYGAPAKGNTLLSFLGLGPGDITYIADRSPLKQGRYTPGTHIPIVAPARLPAPRPPLPVTPVPTLRILPEAP